jgi:hypothetical protein
MNWEEIAKVGTANLALIVIGVILWQQVQAIKELAEALVMISKVYTGG